MAKTQLICRVKKIIIKQIQKHFYFHCPSPPPSQKTFAVYLFIFKLINQFLCFLYKKLVLFCFCSQPSTVGPEPTFSLNDPHELSFRSITPLSLANGSSTDLIQDVQDPRRVINQRHIKTHDRNRPLHDLQKELVCLTVVDPFTRCCAGMLRFSHYLF